MDLILYFAAFFIVILAQMQVNGAYQRYKNTVNKKGISGEATARKILDDNGLNDVQIEHAQGILSDHYDPIVKTVRLSDDIYYANSLAAVAIATHECCHAIQHKEHYGFIALRNSILPVCSFASSLAWPALFIGIFFSVNSLLYIGIIMLAAILIFQIITLPIEFNASSRALKILSSNGLIEPSEIDDVKKMLNAAALTYVAAVISSALQILRFLLIANRNRRR